MLTTKSLRNTASLTSMALCFAGGNLIAGGFRMASHDAFASSRGEAFVATADNPSAVYYNPAGLTQLKGWQTTLGAYTIYPRTDFSSAAGSFDADHQWFALPHVYASYGPENLPLSFGLGAYVPFGLGIEWPEDVPFRNTALESELTTMTLNPVIAWQVLPSLSLGGGPTINFSETELRRGTGFFPVPMDDSIRFKGDDTSVGFNLGARWQPLEKLAFGVTYRSKTTMDYDGYTVVNPVLYPGGEHMDASASMPMPESFAVGLSFRPTKDWNIEFNVDRTSWSSVDQLSVEQAVPIAPVTLNWESSWYYELGVTRYLSQAWSVSGGYIFNQSCMPSTYYNPLVADIDKHFVTAGLSWKGKRAALDLAYQFGISPELSVSDSVFPGTNGDYNFQSHSIALSFNWQF